MWYSCCDFTDKRAATQDRQGWTIILSPTAKGQHLPALHLSSAADVSATSASPRPWMDTPCLQCLGQETLVEELNSHRWSADLGTGTVDDSPQGDRKRAWMGWRAAFWLLMMMTTLSPSPSHLPLSEMEPWRKWRTWGVVFVVFHSVERAMWRIFLRLAPRALAAFQPC